MQLASLSTFGTVPNWHYSKTIEKQSIQLVFAFCDSEEKIYKAMNNLKKVDTSAK